jgi:hypothetical protein
LLRREHLQGGRLLRRRPLRQGRRFVRRSRRDLRRRVVQRLRRAQRGVLRGQRVHRTALTLLARDLCRVRRPRRGVLSGRQLQRSQARVLPGPGHGRSGAGRVHGVRHAGWPLLPGSEMQPGRLLLRRSLHRRRGGLRHERRHLHRRTVLRVRHHRSALLRLYDQSRQRQLLRRRLTVPGRKLRGVRGRRTGLLPRPAHDASLRRRHRLQPGCLPAVRRPWAALLCRRPMRGDRLLHRRNLRRRWGGLCLRLGELRDLQRGQL